MLLSRCFPEAKQIVCLENFIKNKAEKKDSHDSVNDHYPQKSSFRSGKRRIGLFQKVSPSAWNDTEHKTMSQKMTNKIQIYPLFGTNNIQCLTQPYETCRNPFYKSIRIIWEIIFSMQTNFQQQKKLLTRRMTTELC